MARALLVLALVALAAVASVTASDMDLDVEVDNSLEVRVEAEVVADADSGLEAEHEVEAEAEDESEAESEGESSERVSKANGCEAPGTESCYACLSQTDSDGLKCRFDSKALECWSQSGRVSSRGREWIEYSGECAGVKKGKPRPVTPTLTTGGGSAPASTTPQPGATTPGATTPATPTAAPTAVSTPSFAVDWAAATKACNTHFYRNADGGAVKAAAIMRVGCTFTARATGIPAAVTDVGITAFLARQRFGELAMGITSTSKKVSDGVFDITVTLGDAAKAETAIGEYRMYLVNPAKQQLWVSPLPLYIVFNPYAPTSPTYIADAPSRKDWVENEAGAMWVGSGSEPYWSPWTFDQFDFNVWQVVFGLTAKLSATDARDPVKVVRQIAGFIGSNVLEGRWNEPYDDADTAPWLWSSSRAIYKVVNEKKRKAKYGQCMIFSMVTASALRTIGVAAQSNTGYDFVQEKGGDLTVRVYWKPDAKGNYVWDTAANDKNGEKLWNFHAWSLAHISRPDLGAKEVSVNIVDGTWHAGPGRLVDFKAGKLSANYDLNAYNPSINSKVLYLNLDPKTGKYLEWADPFIPAGKILTTQVEKPGGCSRKLAADGTYSAVCWEDLVGQYKSVIRQPQNRPAAGAVTSFASVRESFQRVRSKNRLAAGERVRATTNGVAMVSYLPLANRLGNDFAASFGPQAPKQAAGKIAKVTGVLSYQTYDGQTLSQIKSASGEGAVRLEVSTADFTVAAKKHIRSSSFIVAHFAAYDAAGSLLLFEERKMAIKPPKLNMLCGSKSVLVGSKISCNVNFYNPLPFPIKATLDLVVSGNTDRAFKPQTIVIPGKAGVAPEVYRGWFRNVQFATTTPGQHTIVASLKTDALNEVKGAAAITVVARPGRA